MSCSSTASATKANLVRRCATRWRAISDRSNAGDRSSWRWAKRSAAAPDGCCCRGRRATASPSTNGRRIIATHWRAAPILALDMYEHSYHMDFGAKAASYVDTFMDVIRWNNVQRLFVQTANDRGAAGDTRQ